MLARPYVGSYSGENGTNLFPNHGFLHYPNQLKYFLVSIIDMPTIKYGQNLECIMDKAK